MLVQGFVHAMRFNSLIVLTWVDFSTNPEVPCHISICYLFSMLSFMFVYVCFKVKVIPRGMASQSSPLHVCAYCGMTVKPLEA